MEGRADLVLGAEVVAGMGIIRRRRRRLGGSTDSSRLLGSMGSRRDRGRGRSSISSRILISRSPSSNRSSLSRGIRRRDRADSRVGRAGMGSRIRIRGGRGQ